MIEKNRTQDATVLLAEIEAWCARTATPETSVGHKLFLHPGFVGLLRLRLTLTEEKEAIVRTFMNDHPDGWHGILPTTHANGTQPVGRASSPSRRKAEGEKQKQHKASGEVRTVSGIRSAGEPCWRCDVRADVGCKHRPATGDRPASLKAQEEDTKRESWNDPSRNGRRTNGLNFHGVDLARNLEAATDLLGLRVRK